MAEWEILFNPVSVGRVDFFSGAQRAAAIGAFAREKMAFAGARTHHFAFGGNLEPLGYGFACFNSFWASHISTISLKMSAKYRSGGSRLQVVS